MRYLLLICALLTLSACKIVVTVPEGARVTTLSGNYACEGGQTCTIDVKTTDFDETFRVEVDSGLQWRWRNFPRGLCGGRQDECRLYTSGFVGNDALLGLLASDEEFYLEPKLWPAGENEVGGVGMGTITGFGSVIINQQTRLMLDDSTRVRIDGDDNPSASDLAEGMVATFTTGDDTTTRLTSGTALTIDVSTEVKGPITAVSPLRVLGQLVIVTGDTLLDGMPTGGINALPAGAELEVHGTRGATGEIQASLIQYKPAGIPVWKLNGTVASVSASGFRIGDQQVQLNGVSPRDCAGGLANGARVEAKFSRDPGFRAGNALSSTTDVECRAAGLAAPTNPLAYRVSSEFEGTITRVINASRFEINGQVVELKATTRFRNGTRKDLVAGVRVEAEGQFDTLSGALLAREVKFKGNRVRIEAPYTAGGNASLTLLGIPVLLTAVTEDEDRIAGGASGLQVEVRGYTDSTGQVVAESVRERGDADPGDVRLRGPAAMIDATGFSILGIRVNTETAREFRNRNGLLIDRATFFSLLADGTNVSAEDASYDGSGTLNRARLELED
ncbi:DUF5666 domain-containing protein [Halieaceae bacterium]|nr:DUF5666 domain-containing protein [Halieaceae bacterium]